MPDTRVLVLRSHSPYYSKFNLQYFHNVKSFKNFYRIFSKRNLLQTLFKDKISFWIFENIIQNLIHIFWSTSGSSQIWNHQHQHKSVKFFTKRNNENSRQRFKMLRQYFLISRRLDVLQAINTIKILQIVLLCLIMAIATSSFYKHVSLLFSW